MVNGSLSEIFVPQPSALKGMNPVLLMGTDAASAHEFVTSGRDQPMLGLR
jgi:hypothetical protein